MTSPEANQAIRYEPDEPCPPLVALGVGIQGVMLVLATIVLIVAVTARAGNQDDSYLMWAVFASLVIAGGLTALQAARLWRFGAGHLLIMGPTPNYVAVSVLALAAGGPPLLASLTVAASLFYIALSAWLPLLRRIITPVVSGSVLMLIAATILPVALGRVNEVPDGTPAAAGPVVALVTLIAVVALALRVSGAWRVWSPLIGIAAGCVVAVMFGAYEIDPVRDARWFGLPGSGFPGIDLTPGIEFWALLPAFVVIAGVGSVKNIGDCIAIQQVSWRRPRVTDFRLVQGSLNTNGAGILLSGLTGTPPTSVYSSSSPLLVNLTGVAARRVGYAIGTTMVVLALLPKVTAVLLAIPSPVMGAYLLTAIGVLFVSGVQTVVADGLDRGKALTVGIAFSVGVGLNNQTIGADLLGQTWGPLIDNGMLAGALVAVLMTRFVELTSRGRRARLSVDLRPSAAGEIDDFLRRFGAGIGWDDASAQRLRSAGEETLASLLQQDDEGPVDGSPSLIIVARHSGAVVEMEFLAVFDEQNLEDRLAHLGEESQSAAGMEEGEISLRLLKHYASSVHHQKFHGLDVVTVQVRASG
jgi:NCS2 family nucleobase:cation symporter-2/xanthine permease XanP